MSPVRIAPKARPLLALLDAHAHAGTPLEAKRLGGGPLNTDRMRFPAERTIAWCQQPYRGLVVHWTHHLCERTLVDRGGGLLLCSWHDNVGRGRYGRRGQCGCGRLGCRDYSWVPLSMEVTKGERS